MSLKAKVSGSRSNTGCVREHNEDSLVAKDPLYAVADGMGGHAAGEVASEIAIDLLTEEAYSIHNADELLQLVRTINRSIIEAAKNGIGRPGMGTTLTVSILDGSRILIAQVGDSRAYLMHQGVLKQLTRDHSYVAELLAGGHISAEEALHHPKRSVITRALGSDPKTEADIYELEACVGDRLLLCSDGLYGMVSDNDIAAILSENLDPQDACDALIEAARSGGGLDNISAIVVDITSAESTFLEFSGEDEGSSQSSSRGAARRRGSHSSQSSRKIHLGVIAFIVLLVLLIGSAIGGVYWYASNSAFLRTNDEGLIEVYRGLPGEVLPGMHLEWFEYTTDVEAADLISSTANKLEVGVQVDSLNDAAELVANYREQIEGVKTPSSGGNSSTDNSNSSVGSSAGSSSPSSSDSTTGSTSPSSPSGA